MALIKLKAGETVVVAAIDPSLEIGGGPMPGGEAPVDPGYGIDAGLGYLRPTHPIVLPPPTPGKPAVTWELKTAWTPVTGWIVVAVPTGPTPTPSARRA